MGNGQWSLCTHRQPQGPASPPCRIYSVLTPRSPIAFHRISLNCRRCRPSAGGARGRADSTALARTERSGNRPSGGRTWPPPQRESANSRRTGAATVRRHAGRPCRRARPAAAAERPGHCGRHEAPLSPGGSVTADTASPRQSPCGEHKAPSAGRRTGARGPRLHLPRAGVWLARCGRPPSPRVGARAWSARRSTSVL